MRLSGTLRSWNDERGFGFIAPTQGGAELFVHISALPRDGSRPTIGEKLTYELGRRADGQPQATRVERQAIGAQGSGLRVPPVARKAAPSALARLVGVLLLLGICAYGFKHYQSRYTVESRGLMPPARNQNAAEAPVPGASDLRCDGRLYCSQMTSCAEAKWFLDHCPGTQMDGDHDGVPCEQQWCTSLGR